MWKICTLDDWQPAQADTNKKSYDHTSNNDLFSLPCLNCEVNKNQVTTSGMVVVVIYDISRVIFIPSIKTNSMGRLVYGY